ncbi:MAG: putative acyltransferase [Gammaproteobacteria bacterium]|nr:putative acyltransferase [Gammaproteobacteria bacterium]
MIRAKPAEKFTSTSVSFKNTLSESSSLVLDVIRFTAALMVFAAHATNSHFALGFTDRKFLGDIAVPVFFVLSGFIIRYVTRTRESAIKDYLIDRASRVYSVVLPALLFTVAAVGISYWIDRDLVLALWPVVLDRPLTRLGVNLIFAGQVWGHDNTPALNPPFWSLGYECVYYVLYGVIFYLRGWRRIFLCLLIALLIGPQVLFLYPVWWLGCLLYDFYVWGRDKRFAAIALAACAAWFILGITLLSTGQSSLILAPARVFEAIAGMTNPLAALGLNPRRGTMFAVSTGVVSTVFLFFLLLATHYIRIPRSHDWAKRFRPVADGTFAIYLMHYPFIALLVVAGVLRPQHAVGDTLVFAGMCAIMTFAAVPIDVFKNFIRRSLQSLSG